MNDRWQDRSRNRLLASNPHFATCRTGHELDISDRLLQLIEDSNAPPYESAAIHRRLDALRVAIEQSHAECVFKISDHFRNGGLRNTQLLRRLCHAPTLDNREKYMQIAQLEPAANLAL